MYSYLKNEYWLKSFFSGQPIMEESETMTYLTVLYYIRSKFYGSATLYCETALKNCNDDPQLLLFRAICLIFDGSIISFTFFHVLFVMSNQ